MTTRENTWLRRDETQQERMGAIRLDTVTEFWLIEQVNQHRFVVGLGDGRTATLGTCDSEYRDRMAEGFLMVLRQAQESEATSFVIEAVPRDKQDGPDAHFWWVYENAWS
jgi:hypothetical protein